MFERLAPALFVLIWSTGWIVGKYVFLIGADPITFLALRYVTAGAIVTGLAVAARAAWPASAAEWAHAMITGVLLHAIYLGGVWWAVAHGLPAGISALLAATQPLMTAFLAWPLLGERVSRINALGIAIGFVGVLLVLAPRFSGMDGAALGALLLPIVINIIAMIGVTLGTFYQKRFGASGDLRSITAVQYLGALVVTLPLLPLIEPEMRVPWKIESLYALGWSVLVLSIGAIFLMLEMIRRGKVSKVASLIYLIPPTAAVQAWFLFGETLTALQVAGMAVTAAGVYLATRR
jgi:drug/metabolite transporter (DMT)-like permease